MNALKGCKTVYVRLFLLLVSLAFVQATLRCYSSEQDRTVKCSDEEAVCFTVCSKNITIQGCSWGSCDTLIAMFPHISDCKNCKEDNCNFEACVDGKVGAYQLDYKVGPDKRVIIPDKREKQFIRIKNSTRYKLVWPDPVDVHYASQDKLTTPIQPKIRYTHPWNFGTRDDKEIYSTITSVKPKKETTNIATEKTDNPTKRTTALSNSTKETTFSKSKDDKVFVAEVGREGTSGANVNELEKILTLLLLLTLLFICLLSTSWIFLQKWLCMCKHATFRNVCENPPDATDRSNLKVDNLDLGCVKDYPCEALNHIYIKMMDIESAGDNRDCEKSESICACKKEWPRVTPSKFPQKMQTAGKCRTNSKPPGHCQETADLSEKLAECLEIICQSEISSVSESTSHLKDAFEKNTCKFSTMKYDKENNKTRNYLDLTEKSRKNVSSRKHEAKRKKENISKYTKHSFKEEDSEQSKDLTESQSDKTLDDHCQKQPKFCKDESIGDKIQTDDPCEKEFKRFKGSSEDTITFNDTNNKISQQYEESSGDTKRFDNPYQKKSKRCKEKSTETVTIDDLYEEILKGCDNCRDETNKYNSPNQIKLKKCKESSSSSILIETFHQQNSTPCEANRGNKTAYDKHRQKKSERCEDIRGTTRELYDSNEKISKRFEYKSGLDDLRGKKSRKQKGFHRTNGDMNNRQNEIRRDTILARVDNSPPQKKKKTKSVKKRSNVLKNSSNSSCSFMIASESSAPRRATANHSDRAIVPCHNVSPNGRSLWPSLPIVSSVRYFLVPGFYVQGLSLTALQMMMSRYQTIRNRSSLVYHDPRISNKQNPND